MPKHLLLAHDLSTEADIALLRAAQLARQLNARLSLAHVLCGDDEAAARRQLDALAADCSLPIAAIHVRKGPPVESLTTLAEGVQADLLVLGRHRPGAAEGFAGTTLERLLLACPVPLLLVVDPTGLPYSRALSALDFSSCASRAWQQASRLLDTGGELQALHIREGTDIEQPSEAETSLDRELLEQLMSDLSRGSERSDLQLGHRLRCGERLHALEAALAEFNPQLLALGVHSRGEMSSALVGSLARQLLEQPPCDLLLAR